MEEAVFEHLGKENFHPKACQFFQINAFGHQRIDIGNRRAIHPLHGHDGAAAKIKIHFRHDEHGAVFKLASQLAGIGRFVHQIQFIVQVFIKLLHHFARFQALAIAEQFFQPHRAPMHQGQILLNHRLDVRSQDFNRYFFAS